MNNKLKFSILFLIITMGVFLTSCISNVEEQLEEEGEVTFVSFKDDVKPIIDGSCLNCHSADGNSPELTSYAKISASAASVKDAVATGRMPQGGTLTTAQIKSIVDWVDEGALNN